MLRAGVEFLEDGSSKPSEILRSFRRFSSGDVCEVTVPCFFSFRLLKQVTDFNEICYELYAITGHRSLLGIISYVQ
jgi:hypothetical protein